MTNSGALQKILAIAKNKEYAIPLKILIYCFHGGAVCIFPFLVLHMQLLGVSIKEIAIVSLIVPIAALLGPIMTGLIADKFGRYGLVLVINIVLLIVSYDLFMGIPRVPHRTVVLDCDRRSISIPDCSSCFRGISNDSIEIEVPWKCETNQTTGTCQNSTAKITLNITAARHTAEECRFKVEDALSEEDDYFWNCASAIDENVTLSSSSNCKDDVNSLYSSSFYMYFMFRAIVSFVQAAAFSMLDTSILSEAKRLNLSIGKQRVMVMLGYSTTPLLSGALTDYYSSQIGYKSHMPAFVVGSMFLAISAIIMLNLNVRVEQNQKNVVKDFLHLLGRIEVLLFLIMLLLLGTNFGFIEAYLFIFMNSLGSPAIALGLTITVGCTASIPVLYFSDWIHKKISRELIYLICFTAYAVRLAGYSLITNPWWALVFEALEAINYQLMWVTSLKFFPILAPKTMLATMTGLAMATHYAFGQGVGGFVGGYLIEWYGYATAFQIMAVVSLFAGVFSYLCHTCVIKKRIGEDDFESSQ